MLWDRPDGVRVRDASVLRLFMPYLLRTRNESFVLFEQELDLTRTLRYLDEVNAPASPSDAAASGGGGGGEPVHLFHVLLAAMTRVFGERPQLNRFVAGGKLYQRRHIELSFAIKKQRSDSGALTTTKLRFVPTETPRQIAARVHAAVGRGRSGKPSRADQETALVMRLPGPLLRLLLWLQRGLDAWNLLPAALIDPDPLYCSIFLANLGSIGLPSAYHHLFEYGACSFFAVIGRVQKRRMLDESTPDGGTPTVIERETLSIKYTFDERITDGWYCARSLEMLQRYVEDPWQLEAPPGRPELPAGGPSKE